MATKVTIDKSKKTVTIVLDLMEPKVSGSGKSLVIATTSGNKTMDTEFGGKPVTIGVNVYIPNK